MKNQILLPVYILLLISGSSFAQWTQVSSPTTVDLSDVFFPSSQTGYAAGKRGTILKTINGGNNWSVIQLDTNIEFNAIHFTGDSVGYVTGDNPTSNDIAWKTTDGGANWTTMVNDSTIGMRVYFINDSVGFASSVNDKLYKTTNAGNSWSVVNLHYSFRSVFFTNDSTGYFFANGINQPVFKTTDTGQSFTQVYGGWYTTAFEASHFINDSEGYACAWYSAFLEKTTDGGITWSKMDSAFTPECTDVFFANSNIGYYIKRGSGMFTIRGTNNGGATWATQLGGNGTLNKFYFTDSLNAIVVGNSGVIYKTANGGAMSMQKNNLDKINYSIYPNPVANKLTVDINDQTHLPATIKIYSVLGEELFAIHISNPQTTIDMEHFSKGLYFLKITNSNASGTTQEIIRH